MYPRQNAHSHFAISCLTCLLSFLLVSTAQAQTQNDEIDPPAAEDATDTLVAAETGTDPVTLSQQAADEDNPYQLGPLLIEAEYRFWTFDLSDFAVDRDELAFASGARGFHRFRLALTLETDFGLSVNLEGDLLADEIYGEVTPLGVGVIGEEAQYDTLFHRPNLLPRNAWIGYLTPIGQLRAGLMSSNWGLGILANNGDDRDDLFGNRTLGDIVIRGAFATKPLLPVTGPGAFGDYLVLALAADLPFIDGNANRLDGDEGYQLVAALFYDDREAADPDAGGDPNRIGVNVGGYAVHRDQTDEDGSTLIVDALDATAAVRLPVGDWELGLAGEIAWLFGETTRLQPEASPSLAEVDALGYAIEASAGPQSGLLNLRLLFGRASGDANLDDGTIYRFRFNGDYNVGAVLFDRYLPTFSRRAVEQASDPLRSAVAPKGIDGLVGNGGIENALYIAQVFETRPVHGLRAGLMLLYAEAAESWGNPLYTVENGGIPIGPLGGGGADHDALGFELDLAIMYDIPVGDWRWVLPQVRLEYGVLFPGDAFANPEGETPEPVHYIEGRLSLRL